MFGFSINGKPVPILNIYSKDPNLAIRSHFEVYEIFFERPPWIEYMPLQRAHSWWTARGSIPGGNGVQTELHILRKEQ